MYYLRSRRTDILIGLLLVIFALLLLGKLKIGEGAGGFYVVRPTHWVATPTELNLEITSFYPANLVCKVSTPFGEKTVTLDPRSSTNVVFPVKLKPNTYVTIPLTIDCGVLVENGKLTFFVFT